LKMNSMDALYEEIDHSDVQRIGELETGKTSKALKALDKLDPNSPLIARIKQRKKELKRQKEEELKRQREEELKRQKEEERKRQREEELKKEKREILLKSFKEVRVGNTGKKYTFPVGEKDREQATIEGSYWIATTQTTYEQWYEVRIWAEANGYVFQNKGREGSDGNTGLAPTETKKQEPVTTISWRDTIVWTNALSEIMGFEPVYRTKEGNIIKDSRDSNELVVDAAIQTDNKGYRLPTSHEWEMAARWRNNSGDGSIMVDGRYWTPGKFASGAKREAKNDKETERFAWYISNSGYRTHPVGEKTPNHLGLYDMSGNMGEWVYDWSPGREGSDRIIRGGSYSSRAYYLQVGLVYFNYPNCSYSRYGFRLVRGQ
jgi:formylglycine-generating enzyme